MTQHEDRVREILEKIATEQNVENPHIEIKPVTSGGANYTSQLYLATISGKNRDDIHTFVKVATMGSNMREQIKMNHYDTEYFVYVDLLNDFSRIEERNNLSAEHKFKVPIFYGANKTYLEEVLVLENLVKKGFGSFDRFMSLDWQYAAAAITELAKFHALSMALHEENPEKFEKVIKDHEMQQIDNAKSEPMFRRIFENTIKFVREENRVKFGEKLIKVCSEYMNLLSPLRQPVLEHGDYRPSNLMHKKRNDGSIEVIVVDYQTLRGGSPVVDLLYFIITGTDAEFRAQYYQKLLDHYYAELRAALIRLGLNPDEKYSRDDFEFELKEKLPYGLAVAVFTLPMVTVEADNAPKIDEDTELSGLLIQKTGSQFPERLNGIIDDFVRWGIL